MSHTTQRDDPLYWSPQGPVPADKVKADWRPGVANSDVNCYPMGPEDAVGYPYDWQAEIGYKIERQEIDTRVRTMGPDAVIHDADHEDIRKRLWPEDYPLEFDPWINGRYALAALVWGALIMLVISLSIAPAHASGTAKKHPGTKVEAFVKQQERPKCLESVRVVGSQDIREDAAESSAKKAWSEMVRWQHGESFQDFELATGYSKRCSRSSIGEALGQYFTRCEIEAQPCRAGMVKGADK